MKIYSFKSLRYYLTALAVPIFTLLAPLGLSKTFAATTSPTLGNGFSISPVESLITINRGSSGVVTIYIANPTKETLIANPIVNDFTASADETGQPSLILNNKAPLPANNFKSLVGSLPSLTIAAGQQESVAVTINVPKNANPGGYYGAIRFIPTLAPNQQGNIGLTASVGSLVLLTVPGNLVQKLSIVGLSAEVNNNPNHFFTSGNIGVFTRVDNLGNIHVAPFGKVEIKDMTGKVIDNIPFNTTSGEILPSSIRKYTTKVPNRSWFGKYTVIANLGYGSSGALITGQSTFWYLPVWFIIVAIIIVVALVALIYWIIHNIRVRRAHNPKRR